ncbi:hypothetical protein LX32DRAFT_636691 [Colletotrichum zoysiae]|uniref:Uncharacterized protein n=1 Tax=Colletotrichum zoysiae TaxID=1216348 RepID=A0AAD9M7J8_9PEZI|nr:hypothetical protein LX32DRAFT_636691 [Colletotrichum zoysiae]
MWTRQPRASGSNSLSVSIVYHDVRRHPASPLSLCLLLLRLGCQAPVRLQAIGPEICLVKGKVSAKLRRAVQCP